jgi:hypothetical protein
MANSVAATVRRSHGMLVNRITTPADIRVARPKEQSPSATFGNRIQNGERELRIAEWNGEFGSGDCPAKSRDVGEPNHNTRDIRVGRPKAQSPSARSGMDPNQPNLFVFIRVYSWLIFPSATTRRSPLSWRSLRSFAAIYCINR